MPRKHSDWFPLQEERLGLVLRHERRVRGWSQAEMARKLTEAGWPLHQTDVSKLEAGKRPLRVADLQAFADVLGIPAVAFFYMPAGEEPDSAAKLRERLKRATEATEDAYAALQAAGGYYALRVGVQEGVVREIGEAARAGK